MSRPIRVLFVSHRNSARSQIAEVLLRRLGRGRFATSSAGIELEALNPLVQSVLAGAGIDISGQLSKPVENFLGQDFDWIVTLCPQAHDCAADFPDAGHLAWDFPDLAELGGDELSRRSAAKRLIGQLAERLADWIGSLPRPAEPRFG